MNKTGYKLVIAAMLCCSGTAAAELVSKSLETSGDPEIKVYNTGGEIEVEGWSKNEVMVEADLGSPVEDFVFKSTGNDVLIEVKAPKRSRRTEGSDLLIKVPMGASLNLSGVSTDIIVSGVRGRQKLQTVSGDIETAAYDNDLNMETVSGDIVARGDGEPIRTKGTTVSGDIEISDFEGELELSAVSGELVVNGGRFEDVNLQTVNGDIEYDAGLDNGARMYIETVNGEADVQFRGDLSARIDIETFNGGIKNCFGPKAERTSKYAPGRELNFTTGDGDGRVTIRTLNGQVSICND